MLSRKLENFFCELSDDFKPKNILETVFKSIIQKRLDIFDARKEIGVSGFKTENDKLETKFANYTAKFVTICSLTIIQLMVNSVISNTFDEKIRTKDLKEEDKCVK